MAASVKELASTLKPILEERLDDYRLAHSLSVADYARTLARIYGVDADLAYLAGLLHDWDKCLDDDELVKRAERFKIEMPEDRKTALAVLHAQTGAAALAKEYPDIPAQVISAIEKHTLGAVEMSDLDMVIYIADMLEPLRTKKVIEDLRYSVGDVTLEQLYRRCFVYSFKHLIDKGRYIYPNAINVWNAMVAKTESTVKPRGSHTTVTD